MNNLNKEPIWVDFGNSDEDGAVRLFLPLKSVSLREVSLDLSEGLNLWVTDGDVEAVGTTTFRDGIWVAILEEGSLRELDKSSPFHIDNQQ